MLKKIRMWWRKFANEEFDQVDYFMVGVIVIFSPIILPMMAVGWCIGRAVHFIAKKTAPSS
jgi:hypothetical protein